MRSFIFKIFCFCNTLLLHNICATTQNNNEKTINTLQIEAVNLETQLQNLKTAIQKLKQMLLGNKTNAQTQSAIGTNTTQTQNSTVTIKQSGPKTIPPKDAKSIDSGNKICALYFQQNTIYDGYFIANLPVKNGLTHLHYTMLGIYPYSTNDIQNKLNYYEGKTDNFSQKQIAYYQNILNTMNSNNLQTVYMCDALTSPNVSGTDHYALVEDVFAQNNSVPGTLSNLNLAGNLGELKKLKNLYPNLKILATIGGAGSGSTYGTFASNPILRKIFIDSFIHVYIDGNIPPNNELSPNSSLSNYFGNIASDIFDGVDIDC